MNPTWRQSLAIFAIDGLTSGSIFLFVFGLSLPGTLGRYLPAFAGIPAFHTMFQFFIALLGVHRIGELIVLHKVRYPESRSQRLIRLLKRYSLLIGLSFLFAFTTYLRATRQDSLIDASALANNEGVGEILVSDSFFHTLAQIELILLVVVFAYPILAASAIFFTKDGRSLHDLLEERIHNQSAHTTPASAPR